MAISRSQMGKEVRNGPVIKNGKKKVLTLPSGVKVRSKTAKKVMRQARRRA